MEVVVWVSPRFTVKVSPLTVFVLCDLLILAGDGIVPVLRRSITMPSSQSGTPGGVRLKRESVQQE